MNPMSPPIVIQRHARNRRQPRRGRFAVRPHPRDPRTLIVIVTTDGGASWMREIIAHSPGQLRRLLNNDVDALVAHLNRGA